MISSKISKHNSNSIMMSYLSCQQSHMYWHILNIYAFANHLGFSVSYTIFQRNDSCCRVYDFHLLVLMFKRRNVTFRIKYLQSEWLLVKQPMLTPAGLTQTIFSNISILMQSRNFWCISVSSKLYPCFAIFIAIDNFVARKLCLGFVYCLSLDLPVSSLRQGQIITST